MFDIMETWERDFEWLRIRHYLKDKFSRSQLPDLNAVLFLIGVQELGQLRSKFTKEEKQDLMHIAVCRLLSDDGYYEFEGMDSEGWPHWKQIKPFSTTGVKPQSEYLKEKIIHYFLPYIIKEQNKNK